MRWTRSGTELVVALRSDAWKRRIASEFARMTRARSSCRTGAIPFLAWDRMRREGNVRAVYALDATTGAPRRCSPKRWSRRTGWRDDDSTLTWEDDVTPQDRLRRHLRDGTAPRDARRHDVGATQRAPPVAQGGDASLERRQARSWRGAARGACGCAPSAATGVARQVAGRDSAGREPTRSRPRARIG